MPLPLGRRLAFAGPELGDPGFQLPDPLVRITGRRRLAIPGRSLPPRGRGGRTDTAALTVPQHPGPQGGPVDAQVGGDYQRVHPPHGEAPLAECDRVGDGRADYSHKHRRHGVNMQVRDRPGRAREISTWRASAVLGGSCFRNVVLRFSALVGP